jgi:predicted phosphodiesterase
MSLTLVSGDIHCGQTCESYGATQSERLSKANSCLEAFDRFQYDFRNQIEKVLLVGDVQQITGERAVNVDLRNQQLHMLGKGFGHHNAEVVYLAGSADPYHDFGTVKANTAKFRQQIVSLNLEDNRLSLPGLVHNEFHDDRLVYVATHGHMNEFVQDPKRYTQYLLNPTMANEEFTTNAMLHKQRRSENAHQLKGMVYEFAYRWCIRHSKWLRQKIDSAMKQGAYKQMQREVVTDILPYYTTVFQGHNHVPALIRNSSNNTMIANPGSLTGLFRMDPQEPGTFMTVENITDATRAEYKLWQIVNGEYMPL